MPKNIKGGKGHKKGKNKIVTEKRGLLLKDGAEQNYGQITKVLGDLRFSIIDSNNNTYMARLRGKLRGRQRLKQGDLVLFSYRETGEKKVDIIAKYNEEDAKKIAKIEGLIFPESEHNTLNRKNIVFDDEENITSLTESTHKCGSDRIQEIYMESDGDEEDGDDYDDEEDGDDEENGDEEEDGDDEEDGNDDEEESVNLMEIRAKNAVKDKRIYAARDAKFKDPMKLAGNTFSMTDIDIDAI